MEKRVLESRIKWTGPFEGRVERTGPFEGGVGWTAAYGRNI